MDKLWSFLCGIFPFIPLIYFQKKILDRQADQGLRIYILENVLLEQCEISREKHEAFIREVKESGTRKMRAEMREQLMFWRRWFPKKKVEAVPPPELLN